MNSPRTNVTPPIQLDAFLHAADQGDYVTLQKTASGTGVIAVGRTPKGRRVTWVDDSLPGALPPAMATATAAFLGALEGTYGPRICHIVSAEMQLPDAGQPLPSALVHRAVRLAKASQSLFAGANFMTRLRLSAQSDNATMKNACAQAGLDPATFGPGRRSLANQIFAQAFADAAKGDTLQIADEDAEAMFVTSLTQAAQVSEAHAAALADPSDGTPAGGGQG